ncbi:hypothetical protein ACKVMT_01440 [Halobacteriales archaeon Cl-PHB]
MTRRVVAVALVAMVLLAGCLGGPTDSPAEDHTPTPTEVDTDVPGVTNGTLTNVSALTEANAAELTESGGEVQVRQTTAGETTGYRLQLSAGASTYLLNGTTPNGEDGPLAVALWANETTQVVRFGTEDPRYRVAAREQETPNPLTLVENALAGGGFTVQQEATGNGSVVLTADEYTAPGSGQSRFANVSEYDATLVVDADGRIHALTVSAVADGRSVAYEYDLLTTELVDVPRPDWLSDVPASASLQADVGVDVANESVLTLTHRGGDTVPAGSTFTLETNGTTLETPVPTRLAAGDTVYAYRDVSDGSLSVSVDRPAADAVRPLTSPVSVRLATPEGTTLLSASMGWESSSASAGEGTSGSAGGETSP